MSERQVPRPRAPKKGIRSHSHDANTPDPQIAAGPSVGGAGNIDPNFGNYGYAMSIGIDEDTYKPGDVWRTSGGAWGGKNNEEEIEYFDSYESALRFVGKSHLIDPKTGIGMSDEPKTGVGQHDLPPGPWAGPTDDDGLTDEPKATAPRRPKRSRNRPVGLPGGKKAQSAEEPTSDDPRDYAEFPDDEFWPQGTGADEPMKDPDILKKHYQTKADIDKDMGVDPNATGGKSFDNPDKVAHEPSLTGQAFDRTVGEFRIPDEQAEKIFKYLQSAAEKGRDIDALDLALVFPDLSDEQADELVWAHDFDRTWEPDPDDPSTWDPDTWNVGSEVPLDIDPDDPEAYADAPEDYEFENIQLSSVMERNYKQEYERYHKDPKQKKRRAQRNKSRRKMERAGRVKKGDGKDVHHRDKNPSNQSSNNMAILPKGNNRSMNENNISAMKKLRKEVRRRLKERIAQRAMSEDSTAGEEAKRKGLKHVGWGRYADKSGKVTHKSKDGRLVPIPASIDKPGPETDKQIFGRGAQAAKNLSKVDPNAPKIPIFPQGRSKFHQRQQQQEPVTPIDIPDDPYGPDKPKGSTSYDPYDTSRRSPADIATDSIPRPADFDTLSYSRMKDTGRISQMLKQRPKVAQAIIKKWEADIDNPEVRDELKDRRKQDLKVVHAVAKRMKQDQKPIGPKDADPNLRRQQPSTPFDRKIFEPHGPGGPMSVKSFGDRIRTQDDARLAAHQVASGMSPGELKKAKADITKMLRQAERNNDKSLKTIINNMDYVVDMAGSLQLQGHGSSEYNKIAAELETLRLERKGIQQHILRLKSWLDEQPPEHQNPKLKQKMRDLVKRNKEIYAQMQQLRGK